VIGIQGSSFVDEHGRTLMLRGANLGGSSKVPSVPDGATHRREGFLDHRKLSFVGRPFPLDEADEHFGRLARWGLTFLRLLVPWEAVEHEGPGRYDGEYLDYLSTIAARAGEHGISLVIDPHQDMWSRFCGGDGAPGWTLEAAGFDLARLDETGAAIRHQSRGDPFPRMIWPTNGGKLAAATMFTLFFGGNDFAPRTTVDGEPAQEFLQRHYIGAVRRVAERLAGLSNVVGYDTMNEPLPGYIGCVDLAAPWGQITLGDGPTPLQGMALGSGIPQDVGVWEFGAFSIRRRGSRLMNTGRVRAWQEGRQCPWQENGVWAADEGGKPRLLRPDHFRKVNGRSVDFAADYCRPFILRFACEIRAADPKAVIFVEAEASRWPPALARADLACAAFAPHWYDDLLLVTKRYFPFLAYDGRSGRIVVGRAAVRRSMAAQLAHLVRGAGERMGGAPVLLGEFGIPFDMDGGRAFRTGSQRAWRAALDRSFRAIESNLLGCTIWNYAADNTHAHGDSWNGEDLSVFSRDDQSDPADPDSGGRGLAALVRPYPRATAGRPLGLSFDCRTRELRFRFAHDSSVRAPTEIFVPRFQYPAGARVEVSDGTWEYQPDRQLLLYRHGTGRCEHLVRLTPARAGA
jgi:hypothetical protein